MRLVDRSLVDTALGQRHADLAITGGKLVNVITEEIYDADIAIAGKRIAYVGDIHHCIGPDTQLIDAQGKYVVPGLIDPHIHPESAKLTLTRLAEALLPRGTTTIFAALDETWAVTGIEGVRFVLDEARNTPMRVIYHPYAHVPITGIEPASTPAYRFEADDLRAVMDWPETIGTMDTVIDWVLGFDQDVIDKMTYIQSKGLLVHGHDPLESGRRLQAFLTTGIRSDHVPHSAEEAIEKLRGGMWVMFCDGPITHVLPEAIRAITETKLDSRHASFCIDDLEARDAFETGHMDHQIRTAIQAGLSPARAIQMATLNAAEVHRVDHLIGSIAPGKMADIVMVEDLSKFRVLKVIASGELVADNGAMLEGLSSPQYPSFFTDTFHLSRPVCPSDMVLKAADPRTTEVCALVLHVAPDSPMRHKSQATLKVIDQQILSDPVNDVLYCATVERHRSTGNIGLGFVSGFRLNGGTMASSLGSPTCNITCLGSSSSDMALAINHLADRGGGQVLVKDGIVQGFLPLPLGGFMADCTPAQMAAQERELTDILHRWGCPIERPFIFFMMLEIVPLPHFALTEHGVIDFSELRYIDPVVGGSSNQAQEPQVSTAENA